MYSESVQGGYKVIATEQKATIGQSIAALESAWNNLSDAERRNSALIANGYLLRVARDNAYAFGCVNLTNSGIQMVAALSGKYCAALINTAGASSYTDYSGITSNEVQLIVFI